MAEALTKIRSRLAPSFLPETAVLEMTYRCNHRCIFCSCPWESPRGDFSRLDELPIERWKNLILKLSGMGVCQFAFTGGEPLLKDGLLELIEYASTLTVEYVESIDGGLQSRHAPPKLYLLSNGTAVDRRVLEFCKRLKIQLSMSLPGLRTYREHTGEGNPNHVLRMFQEAASLGIATVAGVTVTRKNIHELHETLSAALLAGAGHVLLNRFLPGGRGLNHADELALDRDQICQMLDTTEEVLCDANRNGNVGTELPLCVIERSQCKRLEVGTRCSAAVGFFVVGPSGYVRTCNHSPVRLNHFDEIEEVKRHPYWMRFIRKDFLPATCNGCNSIGRCDGGCREAARITGGEIDAPDPLFAR